MAYEKPKRLTYNERERGMLNVLSHIWATEYGIDEKGIERLLRHLKTQWFDAQRGDSKPARLGDRHAAFKAYMLELARDDELKELDEWRTKNGTDSRAW